MSETSLAAHSVRSVPKNQLFKNIFDFTTAGEWDCMVAVKHLLAIHYSLNTR